MKAEDVLQLIKSVVPDAQVQLQGADCSFSAVVVSPQFVGMKILARQQLALSAFEAVLRSGELHAISLKTWTPDEAVAQLQPVMPQ